MKRKAKVQKQFAYKYKDKDHYKHVVTISENLMKELGWPIGAEVEQLVEGDTLVMSPIEPKNAERTDIPNDVALIHPNPNKVGDRKHTEKVKKSAKRRIQ